MSFSFFHWPEDAVAYGATIGLRVSVLRTELSSQLPTRPTPPWGIDAGLGARGHLGSAWGVGGAAEGGVSCPFLCVSSSRHVPKPLVTSL